ncbi:hypothetical protein H2136_21285 [Aeromonas hydrophila]|uniref:Uncharacterized protein n=1 Tax=Aeromonas hydrophila TaxID=644 RepID=A0A926FPC9_AERHY|nr:hypothetical protein [Aeromonas hydrophila]
MNEQIKDLFQDESINDDQLAAIIQEAQGDASKVSKSMKALGIGAGSKEHIAYMQSLKNDAMRKHGFSEAHQQNRIYGEELANANWTTKQWNQWERARRVKAGYKPSPLTNSQDAADFSRS